MAIVMGLDQHRAQITADWLDTETGDVSRRRISPAHRAGVRRFCEQFRGRELEVAWEATTGRQFVAEEFRRVGAVVHLAEPAETSARRGNKKRAKSDRADARHLWELLIGWLRESWIRSDHILDLRARVRLRHTLSHPRGEWQQRIQAVLYHHGCPQRSNLMIGEGRSWLAAQPLPPAAREQITVALSVIDALDRQLAPQDQELRPYSRRQPGCMASTGQFGVGELTAVTILAELGDARRLSSSRDAVRYPGLGLVNGDVVRATLFVTQMSRGSTPDPTATFAWTALIDRAAATLAPADHPTIPHVADPEHFRAVDRDKAERPRAHDQHPRPRACTTTRPGR